jgi:MFS family permease
MRETIAAGVANGERAAKTAGLDACRDGEEWSANNFPFLKKRFAAALMARSRTARILSPFRILMVGSSVSMLGSRISTVAFPMLVLHLKNSPLITGFVAFAVIAPSALAYVPVGALVDRWNPRRVMLVTEILRGLAVASIVLSLTILGRHISIWFLIPVMVTEEILEIFFTLADRRYLARLMERDSTDPRQIYIEVRSHAVILAGRPIGPFLFAVNPLFPFLADALSFLFSMGSLVMIRRSDEPVRKQLQKVPPKQLARDIGQGASWLRKDRRALLTMFLMAAASLLAQSLLLMFLSEAHSSKLSTVTIGVVLAASGAGGAAGAICSRFLPDGIGGFWLPIQMAVWCIALVFLTTAGGLSVSWSAAAMLILGLSGAIGNIQFGTYLISSIADDMIAKVTGIGQMMLIGAYALGPVLGGATVQRYGVQRAMEILLGIAILLTLLSLLTPEATDKLTDFCHWMSRFLSFDRPAGASFHEMSTDCHEYKRASQINVSSETSGSAVSTSAQCGQEQSQDAKGEFLSTISDTSHEQEYSRLLPVS